MLILDKLCVPTLWMASDSVFVDVSMMHLTAKICPIWQQITKEKVRKPISPKLSKISS